MIDSAWKAISKETIKNCWRKTGILPVPSLGAGASLGTGEDSAGEDSDSKDSYSRDSDQHCILLALSVGTGEDSAREGFDGEDSDSEDSNSRDFEEQDVKESISREFELRENCNISKTIFEFLKDNEQPAIEEDLTDRRIIEVIRNQALDEIDNLSSSEDKSNNILQVSFLKAKAGINILI